MDQSRRKMLKLVATGAAVSLVGEGTDARAAPQGASTEPRWGMVFDLRKCIGCQACTVACSMEHQVPIGHFRTTVSVYEVQTEGRTRRAMLPRTCNQCDNAPCVAVCPTQATYQRKDGVVVVDNTACVGCAYCVQACPYGARFINPETHTAEKCNFCVQRVDAGLLPACVETCVGGARVFGDLNDPQSQVSRLMREHPVKVLKPEAGTEPRVYYIGLDEHLQAKIDGEPTFYQDEALLAGAQDG